MLEVMKYRLVKGGPYIGPKGGKYSDPARTIAWHEVVASEKQANVKGKQSGHEMGQSYKRIKEHGDHVLINVPIHKLNTHFDTPGYEPSESEQKRIDTYSKLPKGGVPIRVTHSARSARKGVKDAFVANGNHRVAAARKRGDTHIQAFMPVEHYDRWKNNLEKALTHKYTRRWKGKDGKWQYEYEDPEKRVRTGLMPVPEKTIKQATKELVDQMPFKDGLLEIEKLKRTFNPPHTEIKLKTFREGGRVESIRAIVRAGSGDWEGTQVENMWGYTLRVVVDLPAEFRATREEVEQGVRKVLAHELTHGADVKSDSIPSEYTDAFADYINKPSEVTARLQDVGRDINRERYKKVVQASKALQSPTKLLNLSASWKEIEPHLTEENKKRFYRMAANIWTAHKEDKLKTVEKSLIGKYRILDNRKKTGGRKLHKRLNFQGLAVSIENRKGSTRNWTEPSGEQGSTLMHYDYGYVKGSLGKDGDHVDVYVGPNPNAQYAYVIDQMKKPSFKVFDEQKCLVGFNTGEEAKKAYLKQYNDDRFFGSMKKMSISDFKEKVMATSTKNPLIRSFRIQTLKKSKDYEGYIMKFLQRNPKPSDKQIHALAQKLGINEHKFEEIIYKLLGSFVKDVGRHTSRLDSDYDKIQLAEGIRVEKEHTDNPALAKEIAKDHLAEFSDYYKRLKKMESE